MYLENKFLQNIDKEPAYFWQSLTPFELNYIEKELKHFFNFILSYGRIQDIIEFEKRFKLDKIINNKPIIFDTIEHLKESHSNTKITKITIYLQKTQYINALDNNKNTIFHYALYEKVLQGYKNIIDNQNFNYLQKNNNDENIIATAFKVIDNEILYHIVDIIPINIFLDLLLQKYKKITTIELIILNYKNDIKITNIINKIYTSSTENDEKTLQKYRELYNILQKYENRTNNVNLLTKIIQKIINA